MLVNLQDFDNPSLKLNIEHEKHGAAKILKKIMWVLTCQIIKETPKYSIVNLKCTNHQHNGAIKQLKIFK